MPKLPECDRCQLYARNPLLVCAVHPTGVDGDACLDYAEDLILESEEVWEPEGASYYNGELIVQPPSAGTCCSSCSYWIGIRSLRGVVLNVNGRSCRWSRIRCIGIVRLVGGRTTQSSAESIVYSLFNLS